MNLLLFLFAWILIPPLTVWNMSVISDDANGYFDEKETHKTLVELQTELYNQ